MNNATNDRIASLDGLRGLSISLVLLSHAARHGWPFWISEYISGALGVTIFFVISGYLITSLILKDVSENKFKFKYFYARRGIRLLPAQIFFIAALIIIASASQLKISTCQIATALTYTKNYGCGGWVDGHLWSLSVEEQYYLFWPACLFILPRKFLIPAIIFLIVCSPLSRALEYRIGHRAFFWLTSHNDSLMMGSTLAIFYHSQFIARLTAFKPWLGRMIAIAALEFPVWLGAHLYLGAFNVLFGELIQSIATAYLIASLTTVKSGLIFRILNLRPIVYVGTLSYSIYIWQQLFFADIGTYGYPIDKLLVFPIDLICALGVGYLSFTFLERPFFKLRRQLHSSA